jgi:hypothetical protein
VKGKLIRVCLDCKDIVTKPLAGKGSLGRVRVWGGDVRLVFQGLWKGYVGL